MSYSLENQTNTIPKQLYGEGSAGGSAVSINVSSNGIILKGDLNTASPITATISQAGITTDNPNGFQVLDALNMNGNDITNVSTVSATTGFNLTLSSSDNVVINLTGMQLNASDFITMTANNDGISLTADDDITLTSNAMGIKLNGGDGGGGNNDITFTTQNVVSNGLVRWNTFPISMTFLHKWQGSFQYPFGGSNTWDISQIQTTAFPTQFLYGTWAVSFSINFHSQGSQTQDSRFACYIDFADGNGTTFSGYTFNQNTPYAQYYITTNYTATSQNPMIITMTDYFDFTGAINQLDIRLNYYADNSVAQNYTITSSFTLMTLI